MSQFRPPTASTSTLASGLYLQGGLGLETAACQAFQSLGYVDATVTQAECVACDRDSHDTISEYPGVLTVFGKH